MSDLILSESSKIPSKSQASLDEKLKVDDRHPREGKEIINPFPEKEKGDHSDSGGGRCCLDSDSDDVFNRELTINTDYGEESRFLFKQLQNDY